MAFQPPVNIPSLSGNNYAAQLHGLLAAPGEAYYEGRRDKIGDEQWQTEQDRLNTAQALAQSNADRNYALELRRLEEGSGPGGENWFGNLYDVELPGGGYGKAMVSNRGNVKLVDAPGGGMAMPDDAGVPPAEDGGGGGGQSQGGRWLPTASTTDLGNQVIVRDKFGRPIGTFPKGGTPPAGYIPSTEPDGSVSFSPGSGTPQELEANQKRSGAQQSLLTGQQQANAIFTAIGDAEDALNSGWATGPLGRVGAATNWATGMPTEQSKLAAAVETVQALTSRDALISMRLESPTGAAVGNVSDFENRLMAATAGVLDPGRDPEGTMRTLADIRDKWEDFQAAREIAYLANFEGLDPQTAYEALDAIRAGKDPQAVLQRVKGR